MKKWKISTADKKDVLSLMQSCGISSLTAAALAGNGYILPETVAERLNADTLADPFEIADMSKAADVLNDAIVSGERICVYGDYDCDGVMSTVILYSFLCEAGADVCCYIPERSDGYGMNRAAIKKLCDDGVQLIVTVDNGISAIDEAEYVYELGMRLVVTDHHQPGETLPRAEAVVDPHRRDCFSQFKQLCGAGVALKLVAALDGGDYTLALEQYADLAAIATIADIVSLTGENRYITSLGINLINNSDRPAVIALKNVCMPKGGQFTATTVAFGIAPRINAAGRYGSPKLAVELFLCEDMDECRKKAEHLDSLNRERKSAEAYIIDSIYEQISADSSLLDGRTICVFGKNWSHGVIGIVASRIMDEFGKPCFIASESDGEIRGSARSFGDFSIFDALSFASDTLEKFGGHPGAGGFTVKSGMTEQFRSMIEKYAFENHRTMPVQTLSVVGGIQPSELTVENVRGLEMLEPCGMDNEKPLFKISEAYITEILPLSGGTHTKLKLRIGAFNTEALLFGRQPSALPVKAGDKCDIAASLEINEFRGVSSVSIRAADIRPCDFEQDKFFAGLSEFEKFKRGEELPLSYCNAMQISREDAVPIYKAIPQTGIPLDDLYMKLDRSRLNYCRYRMAVTAFEQLGIISIAGAGSIVTRVPQPQKADFESAPILVSLRERIARLKENQK